jgi:hypothetical protein
MSGPRRAKHAHGMRVTCARNLPRGAHLVTRARRAVHCMRIRCGVACARRIPFDMRAVVRAWRCACRGSCLDRMSCARSHAAVRRFLSACCMPRPSFVAHAARRARVSCMHRRRRCAHVRARRVVVRRRARVACDVACGRARARERVGQHAGPHEAACETMRGGALACAFQWPLEAATREATLCATVCGQVVRSPWPSSGGRDHCQWGTGPLPPRARVYQRGTGPLLYSVNIRVSIFLPFLINTNT